MAVDCYDSTHVSVGVREKVSVLVQFRATVSAHVSGLDHAAWALPSSSELSPANLLASCGVFRLLALLVGAASSNDTAPPPVALLLAWSSDEIQYQ